MPPKTMTQPPVAYKGPPPPATLDIGYTMGPVTWRNQEIALGESYAFGFNITSHTNHDAVYAVSSSIYGDVRRGSNWLTQVLDPPVVLIPAHGSDTVLVEVTSTNVGDTIEPPRCELIVSAVEVSSSPHSLPGQARLMIMALKSPPEPDPHVHVVMTDPGGSHSKLGSGVQVGQLPITFNIFTDVPGDYTVTAALRDPANWTIQYLTGSPFHVGAGSTAGNPVHVGPLKPGPGALQTDLYLTVKGAPGSGISARFALPVMPWQ